MFRSVVLPVPVPPEIKRFFIEFEKIGTNSCLIVDYGESGSEVAAFGESKSCKQLFGDIKFNLITNLTNSLEISKRYEKPRDYRLKFMASNQISSISKDIAILNNFNFNVEFYLSTIIYQ